MEIEAIADHCRPSSDSGLKMHAQGSQKTSSASSGPASSSQSGQYHQQEPRTPYNGGYAQAANVAARDGSGSSLSHMLGNMNIQNPCTKFGGSKGNAHVAMNAALDWSAANHSSYNNPFIVVPNSTLFGGLPHVSSFVPNSVTGQADQLGQIPYLPMSLYPGLNSMVSGPVPGVQGYTWPYVMNYDVQDPANNKQNGWNSADGQKGSQPENSGYVQYYPTSFMPNLDGSSASGFSYGNLFSQMGSLSLPFQMMKTPNGYVVQNLEALTQQEPPIPHAVPAMWTNPSELTLAKCLENREGITNVYIRGFLPETTDDMLHAYAARFGKIERCKAIVDLDTGLCKG